MVKSMTGYGMAEGKVGSRHLSIEAKSVNHKYCEVSLRVSPRYLSLEPQIVELARTFFNRGRIDIVIREDHGVPSHMTAKIDGERLKDYYKQLKKISKDLGLTQELRLTGLLGLPHVVVGEEEENPERHWTRLKVLLKSAFQSLEKMRAREGKAIQAFFSEQLEFLSKAIHSIQELVPENVRNHQKNLTERLRLLTASNEVDPQRLAQEMAYYVDRTDIAEELHRLQEHLRHFAELIRSKTPSGRKLDFLLQEMNREVNTLSAKSQNAAISREVVECKHSLEKMREQVQNVE